MSYRITGLRPEPFISLYGLAEPELAARGVQRIAVEVAGTCPDRIELRDAEPGETVLLLNHLHQPARTPFRSCHAIFVREGALTRFDRAREVPEVMRRRTLSLRAFDGEDMMIDADLCEGDRAEALIERLFADPRVSYLHAHYARRGCFAARIDRMSG